MFIQKSKLIGDGTEFSYKFTTSSLFGQYEIVYLNGSRLVLPLHQSGNQRIGVIHTQRYLQVPVDMLIGELAAGRMARVYTLVLIKGYALCILSFINPLTNSLRTKQEISATLPQRTYSRTRPPTTTYASTFTSLIVVIKHPIFQVKSYMHVHELGKFVIERILPPLLNIIRLE